MGKEFIQYGYARKTWLGLAGAWGRHTQSNVFSPVLGANELLEDRKWVELSSIYGLVDNFLGLITQCPVSSKKVAAASE